MVSQRDRFLFCLFAVFFLFPCYGRTQSIGQLSNKLDSLRKETERLKALLEERYLDISAICDGRLTLTSATPVTTTNVSAASTLYFTPYHGARIGLYDGTNWDMYAYTERSLALSGLTADKNYDVFLYNNSGTLTLELSTAWTNDTTRADALTTQDGIYVKSADKTRRYLGTFRSTNTTTTEDSETKRFLWNQCNRIRRHMYITEATATWTQTGSGWQQTNSSSANQIQLVIGLAREPVQFNALATLAPANATSFLLGTGIGEDTTSGISGISPLTSGLAATSFFRGVHGWLMKVPTPGYHYYQWMTYVDSGSANAVWYSSSAYSSIGGYVWN